MLAFSYLPGSYSLIRFVLIPAVFVAMACGVAVHDAVRFKAPLRKRLMLGAVGAAGVGLFLYFVIKIYVLSYWE